MENVLALCSVHTFANFSHFPEKKFKPKCTQGEGRYFTDIFLDLSHK